MTTLGDRDPEELLHRHAVAHVVDQWRHIVEPVGVRHDAVIVHCFSHLLETAVQVADLHFGVLDLLPVELGDDPDNPVHGGVRGTHVEKHVSRFEFCCAASGCRCCFVRWDIFCHGLRFSWLVRSAVDAF